MCNTLLCLNKRGKHCEDVGITAEGTVCGENKVCKNFNYDVCTFLRASEFFFSVLPCWKMYCRRMITLYRYYFHLNPYIIRK